MLCNECTKKLSLYISGFLSDMERVAVKTHLNSCDKCSQELAQYSMVTEVLSHISKPQVLTDDQLDNLEKAVLTNANLQKISHKLSTSLIIRTAIIVIILFSCLLAFLLITNNSEQLKTIAYNTKKAGSIHELWNAPYGDITYLSPAQRPTADEKSVFVLQTIHDSSRIVALDAKSGKKIWIDPRKCFGYLLSYQERLYSICQGKSLQPALTALDSRTSQELWQFTPPISSTDNNFTPPIVNKDRIYWESEGTLYSISCIDGKTQWQQSIRNSGKCALIILEDETIALVSKDAIFRFDSMGTQIMQPIPLPKNLSGFYEPTVATQGSTIFIGHHRNTGNCIILSCETTNGTIQWEKDMPPIFHLSLSNGLLLVRSQSIHALETNTGKERWTINAGGCSPIVNEGSRCFVISSGESGRLLQLDPLKGIVLDELLIGGSCAGLVLNNGLGYLSDNKGTVRAFNLLKIKHA